MKYVLDANVALKWVLPEIDSAKALWLQADAQANIHELIAPDVFPVEVAHALTRAERKGIIPVGDADLHAQYPLRIASTFRISSASPTCRCHLFGCPGRRLRLPLCSLADREHCQLVTSDDKLIKTLQPIFTFIIALASLP